MCLRHFPIWEASDTFQSEQFLTLSNLSNFWHFPIWAVSDTFQSEQFLTLSNLNCFWHLPIWAISDSFQYQPFLTLSNSDTFQSKQVLILSKLSSFWHFPILTLSNSDTFQFWHFPILTLSNFAQNGEKWILTLSNLPLRQTEPLEKYDSFENDCWIFSVGVRVAITLRKPIPSKNSSRKKMVRFFV